MSLQKAFIAGLTAILGAAGCASSPTQKEEATRIANQLPDYTVTDPKTGCRYIKDEKNPDKPQQCLNTDFPQRHIK